MNIIRLLIAFFRLEVMGETAYRINFFFQFVQSSLSLLVAIAGVTVIFSYTDMLGGWTSQEILALVGIYLLVGGLIGFIIQPGIQKFIESVRDGTFDFALTKPEDAQLLASIQQINLWSLIDVALGMGVLVLALLRLGERLGGVQIVEFILMLGAGIAVIYSFFLILATLAFWFVRIENVLTIFQSMYEAGRWPVSLYPGWLRYGLTFIIPVAFATTVPAEALIGRLNWVTLLAAFLIAAGLLAVSRLLWHFGLRRYSGTSA